jgi:hypothetical protein
MWLCMHSYGVGHGLQLGAYKEHRLVPTLIGELHNMDPPRLQDLDSGKGKSSSPADTSHPVAYSLSS